MKTITVLAAFGFALLAITTSLTSAPEKKAESATAEHAPQVLVKKWEHLALQHDATRPWNEAKLAKKIVKLGKEGWEMVSVLNFSKDGTTNMTIYYFKRPTK